MRARFVDTDVLIIGGGMAGTGAAWEAKFWCRGKCKVTLVEKGNIERSGAVAMGLSAINTYMGMRCKENTPEDFVKYVTNEGFGIARQDLVYDVARHVDSTVHLFEQWGLPIWKDPRTGCYVREGKWQIMIHGESYKPIVAEAARKSVDELYERVMVTHLLLDKNNPNRVAGAVGFNYRDGTFYVFRAKAVVLSAGGATRVYRPRSTNEGLGRTWYSPWSSGTGYALAIKAGAEMTTMECRLVLPRFKDGYGPVGAWNLLLKTPQTNYLGEDYGKKWLEYQKKLFGKFAEAVPTPTGLRVQQFHLEGREGRWPILMRTDKVLDTREKEIEGFEDFLDMTISQVYIWASQNIEPKERPYELMTTEPYVMGSHAGYAGAWASGPRDIAPKEYFWGYNRMLTIEGLFCAGDACGASAHKFSSGSFTEGRIAGKSAARYALEHKDYRPEVDAAEVERLKEEVFRPLEWYQKNRPLTTDDRVHPNYLLWDQLEARLQKTMDEHAGGWSNWYVTNEWLLNRGLELLTYLKEDFKYAAARDLHELLRVWETEHRIWTAEAVVRHMLFRKETRFPGYYYRSDHPGMDDEHWRVFVNSRYDPRTGKWEVFTRPIIYIIPP